MTKKKRSESKKVKIQPRPIHKMKQIPDWKGVFREPVMVIGACIIVLVIIINGFVWVYASGQYTYKDAVVRVDAVESTDNGLTIWYHGYTNSMDVPADQDIAAGDAVWIRHKIKEEKTVVDREVVRCVKFS